VAVAGCGAIGLGVAAAASGRADVWVLARSGQSAGRARGELESTCERAEGADLDEITVTTDLDEIGKAELVVEAIAEDFDAKAKLLRRLARACPDADLATTTSSLGIGELAAKARCPERFFGLHVFNPVTKMDLIEVCFPADLRPGTADRARAFCEALGKTAIEVPDQAGFVVNRLLFPYLFDAVRLRERTGMKAEAVDGCMSMGAGHPLGPLKLLDFVGADVAVAIGRSLHADTGDPSHDPPVTLIGMVDEGKLGRKSGEGFYSY
jgi:3-hydroxybutyryl-CoA dehydrogenase